MKFNKTFIRRYIGRDDIDVVIKSLSDSNIIRMHLNLNEMYDPRSILLITCRYADQFVNNPRPRDYCYFVTNDERRRILRTLKAIS